MSSTPRSPQPKPPTNSLTFSNTLTGSYMIPADLFKRAIVEEQNNTIGRCCQRLADTLTIVNDALPDQEKFEITDKEKRRWLTDISIEIAKFQGSMYDQKITTFKIAHEKVRQWWNRCKSRKLGNVLFEPLLIKILKYVADNDKNKLSNLQRVLVFIDIWYKMLKQQIKYNHRTMARPMLPIQIYVKTNKFKEFSAQFLDYYSNCLMEERPKWLGFLRQKDLTRISGHNDKNRSRKLAEGFQFALISLKQHIQQHMNFIDHNDPKLDLLQWNETRDTYTVEALRVIATTHDCLSRSKYMAPPINIDNNSLMNMPNYHEKQSRSNHGIILGDMLQNAEVFTPGLFKRGDDCLTRGDIEMKENDNPLGMHALQFRNARSVWNESFSKSQSARPVPPQCMQYGYNKTDSGPGRHGVHSIENNVRITNHEINASNYQMIPEYQPITVSISPQINNGNNNVKKEAMLMNNNGNNHGSETFIVSKDKHVQSRNENCNNGDIQMREQERGQDRNGDRNKNAFSSGSVKKEPVVINPFDDIVDIMSELIKQQTKQEFVMSDLNGRITTLTENVKISDVILDNVSFFKQNCGNMM